jgi:hypothetical protein
MQICHPKTVGSYSFFTIPHLVSWQELCLDLIYSMILVFRILCYLFEGALEEGKLISVNGNSSQPQSAVTTSTTSKFSVWFGPYFAYSTDWSLRGGVTCTGRTGIVDWPLCSIHAAHCQHPWWKHSPHHRALLPLHDSPLVLVLFSRFTTQCTPIWL